MRKLPHAPALLLSLAFVAPSGCEAYRVEYRDRPSFYDSAMGGPQPERVTLDDGTVIVYRNQTPHGTLQKKSTGSDAAPFLPREELEDGTVILRCFLPEHVLANTLTCIREREYRLMWEQLLSKGTRAKYERESLTFADFEQFMETNRNELAKSVNRMFLGLPRNELVSDNLGGGVVRYRFIPQVARLFRFRSVTMVSELGGMKLVVIE